MLAQAVRYLGGAVALAGLGFGLAFIGRRTADPLAASFVQPLTIWHQLLGLAGGAVVLVVGLAIYGQSARFE